MATRIVRLHLALHHHQPFGNLPGVLEDCCRHGYLPLLKLLEEADPLRFNLSYSGPLLVFLADRFPEYLEILQRLVKAGRVEIMVTGFYEPILADLEEDDRLGQLARTREWWRARGIGVRGMWLAEGVWEGDLARTMARAGLDYTVVARERLLQGGVPASKLGGYLLTEHQGECCRLFPNEEQLLRLLPFGGGDELFAYLRRVANRGEAALTCADLAERWVVWPQSRERVLDSGHLRQLLARFREQSEWVHLSLFSETLATTAASGRCYPPPGVSKDLGFWSLPDETRTALLQSRKNLEARFDADQFLPYFEAGSWAGFRARYAESNLMHKKGLWLKRNIPAGHSHEEDIRRHLHEAQCNTVYWYGTSGGIYAPHLREAVWRSLLRAQALLHADRPPDLQTIDADADGHAEVVLASPQTALLWSPVQGGSLVEWSDLGHGVNLCNTMTRYRETLAPVPEKTGPLPDDAESMSPDPWTRHAFQDLFFKKQTTVDDLVAGRFKELGDFAAQPFDLVEAVQKHGACRVVMERRGTVSATGAIPLRLRKTFTWHADKPETLAVDYHVENLGRLPLEAVLGIQINLALPGGRERLSFETPGHRYPAESTWFEGAATSWSASAGPGVPAFQLESGYPLAIWSYPVFCNPGEGTVPICQGHAVVSGWLLDLEPGQSAALSLEARLAAG